MLDTVLLLRQLAADLRTRARQESTSIDTKNPTQSPMSMGAFQAYNSSADLLEQKADALVAEYEANLAEHVSARGDDNWRPY